MNAERLFIAIVTTGLLVSCAPMTSHEAIQNTNMRTAAKNAKTRSDHDAIAKHFEDAARDMQAKISEQKKLLEQYESERLYGWQSHNLKSQTSALIRKYEQTVQSNMKQATSHRHMAWRFEEDRYAIDGGQAPHARKN
ncbi:hypothetical protein C8R32_12212 [Nitrosospira sp. Nsp5]|uniref:Lipoprotein n=1 Tax=Nitrosospira multiformis TaxID=1231 RepID=A0ABY0TIS5_9PROT|nr:MULTISPECIES: hypothetical protein [Nitrosospira]PTR05405.1 hypothetical protein C8R32_12212 [Nitrosospira sp. Nsp5]SDQ90331.1 hypothetical protein SAMN05216402_2757 [Nitrosospira multiformis]